MAMHQLLYKCACFVICVLVLGMLGGSLPASAQQKQANSAPFDYGVSILCYQRIGEDALPMASLPYEDFQSHIAELKRESYNVISLERAVETILKGEAFPDKSVVITLDQAYRSTVEKAVPLLIEARLPFTLFIGAGPIDDGLSSYASWTELRRVRKKAKGLVSFGARTLDDVRMPLLETQKMRLQVNRNIHRIENELRARPQMFAWPYGQYGHQEAEFLEARGIQAALLRASGVASRQDDPMMLPRFSMVGADSGLSKLRTITEALPFPMQGLSDDFDGLSHALPVLRLQALQPLKPEPICFADGLGSLRVEVEAEKNRLTLWPTRPFSLGETNIRCLQKWSSSDMHDDVRWRWWGRSLYRRAVTTAPAP